MSAAGIEAVRQAVERHGIAVRVSVIASEGSAPRETGAAMLVTPGDAIDTIGGGALEHAAIAAARRLMAQAPAPWRREVVSFPLGPALGQCCGGRVKLLLEAFTRRELAALPSPAFPESEPRPKGQQARISGTFTRERRNAPGKAPDSLAPPRKAGARLPGTHVGKVGGEGPLVTLASPALMLRPTEAGPAPTIVSARKTAGDWPAAVQHLLDEMLSGQRPAAPTLVRGRRGSADWYIEPLWQPRVPLFLYGAGHVGRAVVRVLERLPFAVSWIDVAPERFPSSVPPDAQVIAARDPAGFAASSPPDAWHLVMTYSHPLDFAICHAVMQRGAFAYLGLIGSASKRTRFLKRLAGLGIAPGMLARLHCPIGLDGLRGKEPDIVAVSVAADLLRRAAHTRAAATEARAAAESTSTRDSIGGTVERDTVGLG